MVASREGCGYQAGMTLLPQVSFVIPGRASARAAVRNWAPENPSSRRDGRAMDSGFALTRARE